MHSTKNKKQKIKNPFSFLRLCQRAERLLFNLLYKDTIIYILLYMCVVFASGEMLFVRKGVE